MCAHRRCISKHTCVRRRVVHVGPTQHRRCAVDHLVNTAQPVWCRVIESRRPKLEHRHVVALQRTQIDVSRTAAARDVLAMGHQHIRELVLRRNPPIARLVCVTHHWCSSESAERVEAYRARAIRELNALILIEVSTRAGVCKQCIRAEQVVSHVRHVQAVRKIARVALRGESDRPKPK